jgi:hypothetical protein
MFVSILTGSGRPRRLSRLGNGGPDLLKKRGGSVRDGPALQIRPVQFVASHREDIPVVSVLRPPGRDRPSNIGDDHTVVATKGSTPQLVVVQHWTEEPKRPVQRKQRWADPGSPSSAARILASCEALWLTPCRRNSANGWRR